AAGEGEHRIALKYEATGVNLVMAAPRGSACDVVVLQDGKPLTPSQKTMDTRFRTANGSEESYIRVQPARMYALVNNPEFEKHTLELRCPAGVTAFAFTFTSCVDPSRTATAATVDSR
ncbi:MAG: hypothetical protein DMG82_09580, partial [Acidobacteria bacterium]